ncbi:MAG: sugar phosphate nucleotidyltransferase [Candidatus Gottesmanbacteria bacterium]|nr:sugar phosphate nucleotidyltransferase [Candidatus Gottesmanbacteria bacterium]
MKGVILAGGFATRLRPLTLVTNKHLLPIYNKPMVYYPLEAMVKAGVKEVLITSAPEHAGHFANLLKAGEEFGLHLYYAVQKDPKGGIAQAIALAEKFTDDNEPILVILGDNIFNFDLKASIKRFEASGKGAMVFGIHLDTKSRQYGVIEIDKNNTVLSIEEKPAHPKSDIAQIGVYIYDGKVFDYIRKLAPSARGELEVTDLNTLYLKEGKLLCDIIDWWIDAGTSYDELLRANNEVARFVKEGKL